MKTIGLLLLAAMFLAAPAVAQQPATSSLPLPVPQIERPYERAAKLFAALPHGTTLDRSQLTLVLGPEVAGYLTAIGVSRIANQTGAMTITLIGAFSGVTPKGTRVQAAREITFDYRQEGGTIVLDNIVGIEVKPRFIPLWMPVKQITAAGDPAGNTTLKALLGTVVGNLSHTAKLGPDGKTLHHN
jgi:hypothetical protein